ncbi:MAG: amidase [Bryobacteraceae bacterium]|nr:amidase [Bryobacteraceae bacterium]
MTDSKSQSAGLEIVSWNANDLARRIKAKEVSCVEVMDAYLAQIRRYNPRVNAIVALQDEAGLRAQAAERDRQLARGEYLGWMHGMPQAIKDTAWAKGIVSTSGSPILKDFVAPEDAVITERAKKAGAIVIGKTNVPEFALGSNTFNPVYGTTYNPYNLKKTVGGSSGGAAAALAAHMLPVADGSDMGGSIRNPSAYCNVYGLRPSAGVVPFAPTEEVFVQQFATEGPMGRTVKDVAMLLSIQAGHDPRAPLSVNLDPSQFAGALESDVKGKKIAWMGDWNGYFATEPGVLDVCRDSLKYFTSLGCIVEEALPDFDPEELWQIWLTHRAWIIGNYLGRFYADPAKRALMKDTARWEVETSGNLTSSQVFASSMRRSAWAQAVRIFFEKYDFAIAPTAQVFPFDASIPYPKEVGGRTMQTYHQWMGIVLPWTMAGTPIMNAPAGFNAAGLPMGFQIISKRQAELAVLKMSYAYERESKWVERHPAPILSE